MYTCNTKWYYRAQAKPNGKNESHWLKELALVISIPLTAATDSTCAVRTQKWLERKGKNPRNACIIFTNHN